MIKHNLKIGDALVVSGVGVGVLTKQTKRYWYYFFKNRICRVAKEKLWYNIDTSKIQVSFGSTMKRRRKQRKGRLLNLDLHGVDHAMAEERIKSFLNFVELPCKIITGNSSKMKATVKNIVYDYGWSCHEESAVNAGTLIIVEKSTGA